MSISRFKKLSSGRARLSNAEHFSYLLVPVNETVLVPKEQQMIVSDGLDIDGELDVAGEIFVETSTQDSLGLSWYFFPAGKIIHIPLYRQLFVDGGVDVEGEIFIEGELAIGA